jgi:DNA-binding GntR family transcriptional regulator
MSVHSAQDGPGEPRSLLKTTITQTIRDWIIQGRRKPGEQLSDKEIALELNASRTPVREALLQLQSEGLVEVRPQRGTYVFNPDADEIAEICVARGLFEADALRLGMQSDPDRLIVALGRIVAQATLAVEKGDLETVEALDTSFHETLLKLSGNRYLLESYSRLALKMRALRHRLPSSRTRMADAISQHRRIVDLIAVGAVDEAVQSIADHVQNVQQVLLVNMERSAANDCAV